VFILVIAYFVIDSVRKLLVTPSYWDCVRHFDPSRYFCFSSSVSGWGNSSSAPRITKRVECPTYRFPGNVCC